MRSWLLAAALSLCASPICASRALAANCAPAKLTKIVTRAIGPDVQPGTFKAAPLVMYRHGERFMRTEEARDAALNQHLMIVAASPDIWFVNRTNMTGQHIVDPGPTYDVRAPIISGQGVPVSFLDLEFGCEAAFAKSRAHAAGTREVNGRPVEIHALQEGSRRVEILLTPKAEPVEVAYYQGETAVMVIRYDAFESLPDDPTLFRKPDGFTWKEQRPSG